MTGCAWCGQQPPCTYWCGFSRLNYSSQELRRLRCREAHLLRFLDRIYYLQADLGGHFAIENPRTSDISWQKDDRSVEVLADMCQFDMRSRDGTELLRKPIKLVTTHPAFQRHLGRRCGADHPHRTVQGNDTAHSANYGFRDCSLSCGAGD